MNIKHGGSLILKVAMLASVALSTISVCYSFEQLPTAIDMPVFYATNRQRTGSNAEPVYTKSRRNLPDLEYGRCNVTVPSKDAIFSTKLDFGMGWRSSNRILKDPVVSITKSQYPSSAEFWDEIKTRTKDCDRVIIFVHGYNNSFDSALASAADLQKRLHCPAIIFSWPSSEALQGYVWDECNIEWSLPHFRKLLSEFESNVGSRKLTLISHSMGNRLVFWSLARRSEQSHCHGEEPAKFQDVVLTSPDIDTGTFKAYASAIAENADETWILTSENDNALRASNAVHKRKRLGQPGQDGVDIDWQQPPVVPGITTVEFTVLDTGWVGHTIQGGLISDLVQDSKPGHGCTWSPQTDGPYQWFRVNK